MPKLNLEDASLLTAALEGLELQRTRLEEQIQKVRSMLRKGGTVKAAAETSAAPAAPKAGGPRKRRKLSAEGRARIAEAQRKRWAASRKKGKGAGNTAEA
ncbi:MAG: hypothetical protein JNN08_20040 [Bryobacterales bacterium]|nr:hypothetical protein [Bryobacterales bacterium]